MMMLDDDGTTERLRNSKYNNKNNILLLLPKIFIYMFIKKVSSNNKVQTICFYPLFYPNYNFKFYYISTSKQFGICSSGLYSVHIIKCVSTYDNF